MSGVAPEFAGVMLYLGTAYRQQLTAERIAIYADALGDLDIETLMRAAKIAVKECQFFPTPAELRKHAVGGLDDRALVAWSALGRAASRVGGYQSVEIDDPCAADALVLVFGSWPEFCQTEDGPELAMKRQEFMAAYRRAVREAPAGHRVLPGLTDGDPQPVAIAPKAALKQLGDGDREA